MKHRDKKTLEFKPRKLKDKLSGIMNFSDYRKIHNRIIYSIFIILLVFAGVCFYIGWITFLVKPGYCAVMSSKTSGIYEKPIMPGVFTWRWERLLPTNVSLETFDLAPFKSTQVVSGSLPSSKIYDEFSGVKHNFDYNFKFNLSFMIFYFNFSNYTINYI